MKNKLVVIPMLLILLLTITPMALRFESAHANPAYNPSLVVYNAKNRINATLGIKSGSKMTVKGVITNVGSTTLTGLLTSAFFNDSDGVQTSDMSFEWSSDCSTWYPIDPSEVKVADPASGYQVELIIGPAGGDTLNPTDSRVVYIRATFVQDLKTTSKGYSMAIWTFEDIDADRHWDSGETIYSELPPSYDTPIKIDLAIVHTAEIEGTGKFYYSIQDAVNAASSTIILYPGTYAPFTVSGKTSLTIVANGAVVVQGSQSVPTHYANRDAVIFVTGSTDITLDGLDIEGQGLGATNPKSYAVIYESSSGTIKDCVVSPNTVGNVNGVGIAAWDYSDLVIDPCLIKNFGRIGVFFYDGCTGGVYNSTIEGQIYNDENLVNYGIEIEAYNDPCNIEIIGNKIYNCDNLHPSPLWSSAGIVIDGWLAYYLTPSSTVTMICNNIYNNYYGIEVVANPYSWAHYNNIYNNREYGVIEDSDYASKNASFDARYNWWGDASGPQHPTLNPTGIGNAVSDNVNFSPWLFAKKVPPLVHNVAIIGITINATMVLPGDTGRIVERGKTIKIDVTAKNKGTAYENFTVTIIILKYDESEEAVLPSQNVDDLAPGHTRPLTFYWDTTGVEPVGYMIRAIASTVPGERYIDTYDNSKAIVVTIAEQLPSIPVVRVVPAYKEWLVRGSFTLNVTIENVETFWDMGGFSIMVTYNSSIINAINATEGPFLANFGDTYGWFEINNDVGYVLMVATQLPPRSTTSGSGTLFSIEFKGVGEGECDVNLQSIDLAAWPDNAKWVVFQSVLIPYTSVGGHIKIVRPLVGDINADGQVSLADLVLLAKAYGSRPGDSNWNPYADIAEPWGVIGLTDLVTVGFYYDHHFP